MFSLAGVFLLVGCATRSQATSPLSAATIKYATTHSAVTKVHVDEEQVEGDYARVKISPADGPVTDPAWVFLKKQDAKWTGFMLGTAFSREDYQKFKVPPSLWLVK